MRRLIQTMTIATFAAVLGLSAGGCAKQIGDDCSNNVDCSPDGDRVCDIASGGGYCTIEGCDVSTCPEEAVCVRFFPTSFLQPAADDCRTAAMSNPCGSDAFCLRSTGQCAARSVERRFCMKECRADADCRPDYKCHLTGTMELPGAEAIPGDDNSIVNVRFCVFDPVSL